MNKFFLLLLIVVVVVATTAPYAGKYLVLYPDFPGSFGEVGIPFGCNDYDRLQSLVKYLGPSAANLTIQSSRDFDCCVNYAFDYYFMFRNLAEYIDVIDDDNFSKKELVENADFGVIGLSHPF